MRPEIIQIAQDLKSDNMQARDLSVQYAGLLLEKSASAEMAEGAYNSMLPASLTATSLDQHEQTYLVEVLYETISSPRMTEGMLWALGKADRALGLEPLLNILQSNSSNFSEEAMWQALLALDNFVVRAGSQLVLSEQNRLLQSYKVSERNLAQALFTSPRLQKMAEWIRLKIQDSLELKYVE